MGSLYGREEIPAPKLTQWFGLFFGSGMTFHECEVLVFQHIPDHLRREEPTLRRSCWYDYRRLHPVQATHLFAHHYNLAYGRAALIAQGRGGGKMRGFKGGDFLQSREKLQFWRLRQTVDALGMPYDFFLNAAMDWYIAAGWVNIPRPCHINTNEEMAAHIVLKWEEWCNASMQWAADERYRVENWFGHDDQIAYEQFMIRQIGRRANPQFALHTALYQARSVRIETAIREFGTDVVQKAISLQLAK